MPAEHARQRGRRTILRSKVRACSANEQELKPPIGDQVYNLGMATQAIQIKPRNVSKWE